jgi:SAM-dependent methyltransferase
VDEKMAVIAHYEAAPDLVRRIQSILRAADIDPEHVGPDDLALLEEFHALGRMATVAQADQLGIAPQDRVLDVGAGIGGPARTLARRYGCQVDAVDLSPEFCRANEYLTDLTGLEALVTVHEGDATNLPFASGVFDVVWTQHASMNIQDKAKLYGEIARVLRPEGLFALYDMMAGPVQPIYYPVPWADDASTSFLITPEETLDLLAAVGLDVVRWDDVTPIVAPFVAAQVANPPREDQLGTHLLIPDFPKRIERLHTSISEDRLRVVQGVVQRTS